MMTIYIAMPDALLVVRRQVGAWHGERRLEGLPAQCVAADPLRPEFVCCGTFGHGLWRSVDAGATWRQVGAGVLRSPQIMAVPLGAMERAREYGVNYPRTQPPARHPSGDRGPTPPELAPPPPPPPAPTGG